MERGSNFRLLKTLDQLVVGVGLTTSVEAEGVGVGPHHLPGAGASEVAE